MNTSYIGPDELIYNNDGGIHSGGFNINSIMMKKVKLLLLIPTLWTSLFDITITTVHQPKEYWNGNLQKANEGNPIGAIFMENHVYGLFFISIIWILIIGLLGYYLPRKISRVFLLF
jgi:hypothetical protein